jgi:glucose-6-phosphate isomerase
VTGHPLITLPEWKALEAHAAALDTTHMRDLFKNDPDRFARFSFKLGPLLVDYSKSRATTETMGLLLELARVRAVDAGRAAMFAGKPINATENKPALHVALRRHSDNAVHVDGDDVMPEVRNARERVKSFSEDVRSGARKGNTGKTFRHIVNIGIGGSHIGPMFVAEALGCTLTSNLSVHFISNLDAAQLDDVLETLDAATTLFVICSKTFTTPETMSNARRARDWLVENLGDNAVATHVAAVTAARDKAVAFGVPAACVFPVWDWVGGRYSLWSAMSLAAILAHGYEAFDQMLAGAEAVDGHFETAPLDQNLPVLLAMIGIWYADFLGAPAIAILPYDHRLRSVSTYVQQLDMESNGKGVMIDGMPVGPGTAPIVFGGGGSDSQHSFFQLLHQGPRFIPCDFVAALSGLSGSDKNRDVLLSNVFGQTEALMMGRAATDLAGTSPSLKPHKEFSGNRPSNTLLLDDLTPYSVGMLAALYEHKIFVQSLVWGVNAFDQWGVELGKELAQKLESALGGEEGARRALQNAGNSSTAGLVATYLDVKGRAS